MVAKPRSDWSVAYTRTVVAANIRRHRKRRGISVQVLADRCATLGLPMDRSNLAKLELGQRVTMSVDELLVMAKALEVPPLLLLAPASSDEVVEVLPGVEAAGQDALAWMDGTAPAPGSSHSDEGADARAELRLLRDHQELVDEWSARSRAAAISQARVGDQQEPQRQVWRDAAAGHAQAAEDVAGRLTLLRETMRVRGLACPALPPGLIHLDLLRG